MHWTVSISVLIVKYMVWYRRNCFIFVISLMFSPFHHNQSEDNTDHYLVLYIKSWHNMWLTNCKAVLTLPHATRRCALIRLLSLRKEALWAVAEKSLFTSGITRSRALPWFAEQHNYWLSDRRPPMSAHTRRAVGLILRFVYIKRHESGRPSTLVSAYLVLPSEILCSDASK